MSQIWLPEFEEWLDVTKTENDTETYDRWRFLMDRESTVIEWTDVKKQRSAALASLRDWGKLQRFAVWATNPPETQGRQAWAIVAVELPFAAKAEAERGLRHDKLVYPARNGCACPGSRECAPTRRGPGVPVHVPKVAGFVPFCDCLERSGGGKDWKHHAEGRITAV